MVTGVDPNGETFVWCRKCSGYARCRLGPTLIEPLQARKEEHKSWDMLNRILFAWEMGGVPDRDVRVMVVEGEKRRVTRKDFEMLSEDFGDGGFIAQKVLWNIAKKENVASSRSLDQFGVIRFFLVRNDDTDCHILPSFVISEPHTLVFGDEVRNWQASGGICGIPSVNSATGAAFWQTAMWRLWKWAELSRSS